MTKTFYQIQLLSVPNSVEDQLSDLCFDFGALGISENLPLSQASESKVFDIYFDSEPEKDFFIKISKVIPSDKIKTFEFENKDWLEEWKKSYHAFSLVDNIWVVPSWETKENVNPIFIDPGMAFGTGTHQTTQICAELISKVLKTAKNSMLDVGTGTGILAMLAYKLGVENVVGTEIDAESVITANENLEINKIDKIKILETNLDQLEGQYDLIVANIMDSVLLDLKKDLLRLSTPDSSFIFSGILQERDSEFIESFLEGTSLKVESRIQKDEWVGYHLKFS